MEIERRVMTYFGDKRKKNWRNLPPIQDTDQVRCAAGDWVGKVSEAKKEDKEYRCPKCGNYIFGDGLVYYYRLRDSGK